MSDNLLHGDDALASTPLPGHVVIGVGAIQVALTSANLRGRLRALARHRIRKLARRTRLAKGRRCWGGD